MNRKRCDGIIEVNLVFRLRETICSKEISWCLCQWTLANLWRHGMIVVWCSLNPTYARCTAQHHFESMFNYIFRCTSISISLHPFIRSNLTVLWHHTLHSREKLRKKNTDRHKKPMWAKKVAPKTDLRSSYVMVGSSNLPSSVAVLLANISLIRHLCLVVELLFSPCHDLKFNLNSSKWKFYLVEMNKHI